MNGIKKHWWKVLAVVLLIYTLVFTFFIPLSPTIKTSSPSTLEIGNNRVVLTGYNTNFRKGEEIGVNIEFAKKTQVCGKNIEVISKNMIAVEFEIPEALPSKVLHLRMNTTRFSCFSPEIIKAYSVTINNDTNNLCLANSPMNSSNAIDIPNRLQLNETIRNLMLHVPMWFAMITLLLIAFINSIKYLNSFDIKYDIIAKEAVNVALLFAFLGLITGAIWAKFTWSEHTNLFTLTGWWANDVKLNGSAVTTLIYIAYRILRNSLDEEHKKAKISAVYNIFAFIMMVVLILVLPRLTDSLHPGNGGNPAFGKYDLDSTLKMIFYPACIGWILLSVWMYSLKKRIANLENTQNNEL